MYAGYPETTRNNAEKKNNLNNLNQTNILLRNTVKWIIPVIIFDLTILTIKLLPVMGSMVVIINLQRIITHVCNSTELLSLF